jgi:hypothetical protein
MKKLMLDVESLAVESFEVEAPEGSRGTVEGAQATLLLSQCLSACRPSGIQHCLSPQPC